MHDSAPDVSLSATTVPSARSSRQLASRLRGLVCYGCLGLGLAIVGVRADDASTPTSEVSTSELKTMSLEDLITYQVYSVSKTKESLSQAPSAIQVITEDDIRRSGATSIPEALRLADNLTVAQRGAHEWVISARGFGTDLANKMLVMIDGRTVYTPLFSGVFWDRQNYLLSDIDHIEVISGPGGTLWGANAVNGVINIITKSAKDTQGVLVQQGFGTDPREYTAMRYGGKLGDDTSYRVYGTYFERANADYANNDDVNDSWQAGQGGFRTDTDVTPDDLLTLQGDYYRNLEAVPTGRDAVTNGSNLLSRWTHTVSDESKMSLQLYYDHTYLYDPVPAFVIGSTTFAPAGTLIDRLDTYDMDFQHRFRLDERNRIVWGIGFRHTRDTLTNSPSLGFYPDDLQSNLYSAFLQDEIMLLDNLFLTLGSKVEHNSYTGFEYEPNVRLQLNITPHHTVWAAVSRAVRTPSRAETWMVEMSVLPAMRRWNVRRGMMMTSSRSVPKADCPLTSSRPTTSQETLLTRTLCPRASALPNSLSRTVSPRMQAARPLRISPSRKCRPAVSAQS